MQLLRSLVEDSLDEGYARASARRKAAAALRAESSAAAQGAVVTGRRGPGVTMGMVLTACGLVAVGLLLSTAFGQTRLSARSAAGERASLVSEVAKRDAANQRLQTRLVGLRSEVAAAQRRALQLTGAGSALSTRLVALESVSGTSPVVGPGMKVRVDDAPAQPSSGGADVDPRTGQAQQGRVTDRDLQTIVNEVWAAGAEAVSVNGERLTALSAIRSAGDAVLVDFRPLNPPYVIEAIGDPATMRTSFVGGFGGSYLQVLKGYGIAESVTDARRITLSASAGVALRYAQPTARRATTDEGSSGR